jgi:hypothetical protein
MIKLTTPDDIGTRGVWVWLCERGAFSSRYWKKARRIFVQDRGPAESPTIPHRVEGAGLVTWMLRQHCKSRTLLG